MPATSEPRTLEEMQARIREIRARQMVAARRYEASKHPVPVVIDLVPEPVSKPQPETTAEESATSILTPAEIIASIAAERGVTAKEIIGPSLARHVVAARFAAIAAVASDHPMLTLGQIGQVFGGRDHSTVFNALRRAAPAGGRHPASVSPVDFGRSLGAQSPEDILQEVATAYGTTVGHLCGYRNAKVLVAARRVAIIAIRAVHPRLSGSAIALIVNRDPGVVREVLANHAKRQQEAA